MYSLADLKQAAEAALGTLRLGPRSKVWYVSSVHGGPQGEGSAQNPISSLATLLTRMQTTAGNRSGMGDVIIIAAGHTETKSGSLEAAGAAGYTIGVADLSIIGLGEAHGPGSSTNGRSPFIQLTGVTGSNTSGHVAITAQGVRIENVRFGCPSAPSAPTRMILLGAGSAGATIRNCGFVMNGTTGPATNAIELSDVGANSILIEGNRFYQANASGTRAIYANSTGADVRIVGNRVEGVYSDYGISVAGNHARCLVAGNIVNNTHATGGGISIAAGASGECIDNFVSASAVGLSVGGTKSSNNRANGTSLDVGSDFWVTKTFANGNAILAAGADITGVSSGGLLSIEDVIVQCGTIVAGSNAGVSFETNNTVGAGVFWSFGTALSTGLVLSREACGTSGRVVVLESGKKVVAKSLTDVITSGPVTVYLRLRRLAAGASVAAA